MQTLFRFLRAARSYRVGCALLGLLPATLPGPVYMKLGDIKGEATDRGHKDWIIIESMSSPVFRALVTDPTTGYARRRGETTLGDIEVVKELDKSSPKIAEAICNGTFFDSVELRLTRPFENDDGTGTVETRQEPYLTYKLKNVIVSSYTFHGNGAGDPLPTEEITLGYTEVEWTYVVLDPEGRPTETVIGSCAPDPSTGD